MKRLASIAFLLALGVASADAAYVVLLKNGTRVVAREKYQIKGANALIVLKNGTLTSVPMSQVDVAATDKLNARNLGDAMPLDWVDNSRPMPTPQPTQSMATLGKVREGLAKPEGSAKPTPTPGISYRTEKFSDSQVDKTFEEGLERYHLYLYRTSRGTQPGYLFVEVQVNGEPEVLKSLQAVCSVYHLLNETAADRAPARVELRMINESGREAGLFRFSTAEAAELATGKISPQDFFLKYVIF